VHGLENPQRRYLIKGDVMNEQNRFRNLSLEAAFGSINQYSGYDQRQYNPLEYANSIAGSLFGQLGNSRASNRPKPRHIQLLDEAKARHPEWVVKRKEA
jgi:hypothetical protein